MTSTGQALVTCRSGIPRSRIADVTTRVDDGGTTVELALACDCRVSTLFVDGRYLAVDVGAPIDTDPGSAPAGAAAAEGMETPEERAEREGKAVASAEAILLQQIFRALLLERQSGIQEG